MQNPVQRKPFVGSPGAGGPALVPLALQGVNRRLSTDHGAMGAQAVEMGIEMMPARIRPVPPLFHQAGTGTPKRVEPVSTGVL
jgi:hypothetical protein